MNIEQFNNERIFQVVTSTGKQYFCNVSHLNEFCTHLRAGYFKIYSFDTLKPKRVSKTDLKKFFEGQELKQKFVY
jgi:hypothetical protein